MIRKEQQFATDRVNMAEVKKRENYGEEDEVQSQVEKIQKQPEENFF